MKRLLVVLPAAVLLTAGCSVPGGAGSSGVGTSSSTTISTSTPTRATTPAGAETTTASFGAVASSATETAEPSSTANPAAPGADPTAAPSALPVVASRPVQGEPGLAVQLNSVTVVGPVTTLNYTVVNRGGRSFQVSDAFSDGILQRDAAGELLPEEISSVADGVFLLDGKAAQRYLPGRSPSGSCACSANLSSAFVDDGGAITLSAVFKALPPDVTTVSVFVPRAGTFDHVPVTR